MLFKYCIKTRKNITIPQLLSYVFLCGLTIMVLLNTIEAIEIPYNRYMFNRGARSAYAYESDLTRYDMLQVNKLFLGNGYSEEMTQPREQLHFWRFRDVSAFLCENLQKMEISYFDGNLIRYDKALLAIQDDTFPVFLSYDLMHALEASEGDCIILYKYRTILAKLRVCGVLRPSRQESPRDAEALILANRAFIDGLESLIQQKDPRSNLDFRYLTFSNEKTAGEDPIYSRAEEMALAKEYLKTERFSEKRLILALSAMIIVFVACVESGYVLSRNRRSFGVMRRLGLPRSKVGFGAVLIVVMEFLLVVPFAVAFVVFWLRKVLFIHMDPIVFLVFFLIELLLVVIASTITVMIKSRRDAFYTV